MDAAELTINWTIPVIAGVIVSPFLVGWIVKKVVDKVLELHVADEEQYSVPAGCTAGFAWFMAMVAYALAEGTI